MPTLPTFINNHEKESYIRERYQTQNQFRTFYVTTLAEKRTTMERCDKATTYSAKLAS